MPDDTPATTTPWQPIDTAPQDGTDILLFTPDYFHRGFAVGFWQGWLPIPHWSIATGFEPTHWMPLPEPPQ